MTNTGHRYTSLMKNGYYIVRVPGPGRPWKSFPGTAAGLKAALAWRDRKLAARDDAAPRRWHRPDFNDLGARAGKVERSAGVRRDEHRQFATVLKEAGLLGEYDDVKLATVTPRDLFGTAACMDLDARANNHKRGRIIVPAPIDPAMAEYSRETFGVDVVEVWT